MAFDSRVAIFLLAVAVSFESQFCAVRDHLQHLDSCSVFSTAARISPRRQQYNWINTGIRKYQSSQIRSQIREISGSITIS